MSTRPSGSVVERHVPATGHVGLASNVLWCAAATRPFSSYSGLGGQFPGFPRAGQFPQRLKAAGIDLELVTDVVLMHMHMDHVGGLLVEGMKDRLRPDLRIHVAAAEVKFWMSPDFSHTTMPKPAPMCFGRPPSVSRTSTAASCGCSKRSARWRQEWSSAAPAAIPLGRAWST